MDEPQVIPKEIEPPLEVKPSILQRVALIPSKIRELFARAVSRFKEKVALLSVSQWFYLAAFILLISSSPEQGEELPDLTLVGVLAGIGLSRELWQLFHSIWNRTLGKGVILIFYAAIANLALAISAQKISAISGIEPGPFVFTLGFTTFLMLPFWIVSASIVFLSIALILGNLWLLLSLLLRVVRIKLPVHWEDKSFVVASMALRIILIPTLIAALLQFINPYVQQMDFFHESLTDIKIWQLGDDEPALTDEQMARIEKGEFEDVNELMAHLKAETQAEIRKAEAQELENDTNLKIGATLPDGVTVGYEEPEEEKSKKHDDRHLDHMIAAFIYYFETYPNSACKKSPEQHSLVIDENLIFVAEKDPDNPMGFKFGVMPCVPRYEPDIVGSPATE